MTLGRTQEGLRKQEQKLNDEITILNLAMDVLKLCGLNNDREGANEPFVNEDDHRIYYEAHSKLLKLQDTRAKVRGKLRKEFGDTESIEACRDLYGFKQDTIVRYF